MTFFAQYMRYMVALSTECETPEEAVAFLVRGEDEGTLSSVSVTDENGHVIYDEWQLAYHYIYQTPLPPFGRRA